VKEGWNAIASLYLSLTSYCRRGNGTIAGNSIREDELNLYQSVGEQPFHTFVEDVEKSPKKLIISLFFFRKDKRHSQNRYEIQERKEQNKKIDRPADSGVFQQAGALNSIDHD
jgi:hypothetical protein